MTILAKSRIRELRQKRQTGSLDNSGRKLSSLIRISLALSRATTLDELFSLVTREVCEQVQADQAFLLLQNKHGELNICSEFSRDAKSASRMIVSHSICDKVMATGDDVLIPEAIAHPYFQSQESVVALNLRSVMAVPLNQEAGAIGVLYVCSYSTGELFGQSDLDLLKACGSQVSIHLDRTRVLAEKERLLHKLETIAASRGRVVEVAKHELATPLFQAKLALELAQKTMTRLDEAQQGQIYQALRQSLDDAMAGINRANTSFMEPLRAYYDLEMLLQRRQPRRLMIGDMRLMIKKWRDLATNHKIQIFENVPAGLVVDPDLFEQALTHLIQNAVNYSEPDSPIEVTAKQQGDEIMIAVADQGLGILPEDLPHVSTWLYRGENVANVAIFRPGLGVGLHSCRRIVEAHGGHLEIESEPGQGTQVTIKLPIN